MKATFETGKRYAVEVGLPSLISPSLALAMLGKNVKDVMIGEAKRGVVIAEMTWCGPRREVDSGLLRRVAELAPVS